jgi:hypothetical protein
MSRHSLVPKHSRASFKSEVGTGVVFCFHLALVHAQIRTNDGTTHVDEQPAQPSFVEDEAANYATWIRRRRLILTCPGSKGSRCSPSPCSSPQDLSLRASASSHYSRRNRGSCVTTRGSSFTRPGGKASASLARFRSGHAGTCPEM